MHGHTNVKHVFALRHVQLCKVDVRMLAMAVRMFHGHAGNSSDACDTTYQQLTVSVNFDFFKMTSENWTVCCTTKTHCCVIWVFAPRIVMCLLTFRRNVFIYFRRMMKCLEEGNFFVYDCRANRRISSSVLLSSASADMSGPRRSGACLLMCTKTYSK